MAVNYDQYTQAGLDSAMGLLNSSAAGAYPSYVSSQANAPTKQTYLNYTPNQPMAQIQAPNYQLSAGDYKGLMGGDYNALQGALQKPGEVAAKTAYDQGYVNLDSTMGGNGLYGSSIMNNQARNALDTPYQNALQTNAAQAAAQRYQLEQTGLQNMNQFNLSREQEMNKYQTAETAGARTQNYDSWRSGMADAERQGTYDTNKLQWQQSYDDQMRTWQNQQQYEQYQYQLAKNAYDKAQQESRMNQSLALAGQGAPLSQANLQYQTAEANRNAQMQTASEANATASQNGWLGAAGTVGGGLLSNWDSIFG
jgi:hypothetical protein